jgi:hypothetical protein
MEFEMGGVGASEEHEDQEQEKTRMLYSDSIFHKATVTMNKG